MPTQRRTLRADRSHHTLQVRQRRSGLGWAVAGLVLIILGSATLFFGQRAPTPKAEVPVVHPFTAAAPDTHTGTPTAPVLGPSTLAIPDVGIQVPILEEPAVNGYITILDTPDSNRVSHYNATAPLGSAKGSTFLAGHVDQKDGSLAPMASLGRVSKGTPIYVTDPTGTIHRYKTTTLSTLRKDKAPDNWFSTSGPAQLIIVTCDLNSPYVPITGVDQHSDYTAVTATPWP
jgi:hypothetical protein